MSEMWKCPPFIVLDAWINAIIEEASDELSDWESTFVEDMRIKVGNGWSLTQGQVEKLEQIYTKHTK